MRKKVQAAVMVVAVLAVASVSEADFNGVVPGVFDPDKTFQVAGDWVQGLGCPDCTDAPSDTKVRGLLLAKSATTPTNAAGGATLKGVNGIVFQPGNTQALGWDVRSGSHCGAGAPRFNVITQDGTFYTVGCSSPLPSSAAPASPSLPNGWTRLRYDPALAFNASAGWAQDGTLPGKAVSSISIVFDEGQDTGPTFSGMAVLDNIFVNGVMVGK